MKYTLGLDLGIASIGWAIYNMDKQEIEKCGVRCFEAAENPKTKESLATARREARGIRRITRRKAYRIQKIRELLVQYKFIDNLSLFEELHHNRQKKDPTLYDVYYLRYNGLTNLLTDQQLVKVLINLAKRRGFKSNRKKEKSANGEVNTALKINSDLMLEKEYQTIGQMLYLDNKWQINKEINLTGRKRNSGDNYLSMVQRSDIVAEAKLILEAQQYLGNSKITDDFIDAYLERLQKQKSFDWKGDIRERVGKCTLEKEESRAAKSCFSSQQFIALSKLNNIKYSYNGIEESLTPEEINHLWNKALELKSGVSFKHVRDMLNLPDDARFNYVNYKNNDYKLAEKTPIKELKLDDYHKLKEVIENHCGKIAWSTLSQSITQLDKLATEITYSKSDEVIKTNITNLLNTDGFQNIRTETGIIVNAIIESGLSFDKNINLSLKVLYKIIPYLEKGIPYDIACEKAGYNHSQQHNEKHKKLPTIEMLGLDTELTSSSKKSNITN